MKIAIDFVEHPTGIRCRTVEWEFPDALSVLKYVNDLNTNANVYGITYYVSAEYMDKLSNNAHTNYEKSIQEA